MTPHQLQNWQPHASTEQLETFIQENQTLFQLLEETWQKFEQQNAKQNIPSKPHIPSQITELDLEIVDIDEDDEKQFNQVFQKLSDNPRNDRPFGDNPEIHDFNWEIVEK